MDVTAISSALGLIFLALLLVLFRRTRVEQPRVFSFLRSGASSLITDSTPTWVSLAVLIAAWLGNAAGCALLWALSIGNKDIGQAMLVVNFASILWSLRLFATNHRAQAIRNLQWVIPCAICAAVAYTYLHSLVA
jgi:hypothetical protein